MAEQARVAAALFNSGKSILNYCQRIAQQRAAGVVPAVRGAGSARAICATAAAPICPGSPPSVARAAPRRASRAQVCGACLANPPRFDRVLAPCVYAYSARSRHPVASSIRGNLAAAPLLADLLLAELRVDATCPM